MDITTTRPQRSFRGRFRARNPNTHSLTARDTVKCIAGSAAAKTVRLSTHGPGNVRLTNPVDLLVVFTGRTLMEETDATFEKIIRSYDCGSLEAMMGLNLENWTPSSRTVLRVQPNLNGVSSPEDSKLWGIASRSAKHWKVQARAGAKPLDQSTPKDEVELAKLKRLTYTKTAITKSHSSVGPLPAICSAIGNETALTIDKLDLRISPPKTRDFVDVFDMAVRGKTKATNSHTVAQQLYQALDTNKFLKALEVVKPLDGLPCCSFSNTGQKQHSGQCRAEIGSLISAMVREYEEDLEKLENWVEAGMNDSFPSLAAAQEKEAVQQLQSMDKRLNRGFSRLWNRFPTKSEKYWNLVQEGSVMREFLRERIGISCRTSLERLAHPPIIQPIAGVRRVIFEAATELVKRCRLNKAESRLACLYITQCVMPELKSIPSMWRKQVQSATSRERLSILVSTLIASQRTAVLAWLLGEALKAHVVIDCGDDGRLAYRAGDHQEFVWLSLPLPHVPDLRALIIEGKAGMKLSANGDYGVKRLMDLSVQLPQSSVSPAVRGDVEHLAPLPLEWMRYASPWAIDGSPVWPVKQAPSRSILSKTEPLIGPGSTPVVAKQKEPQSANAPRKTVRFS